MNADSNECYPPDWARLECMVSPTGEIHAIGGERESGQGDTPYIGYKRIKERLRSATPPSAPTNGDAAPSSWAVEAAKEIFQHLFPSCFLGDEENSAAGHNGECEEELAAIIARHAQSAGDGKDRERLDWLDAQGLGKNPRAWSAWGFTDNIRAAIDNAMAQEGKPANGPCACHERGPDCTNKTAVRYPFCHPKP